MPRYTCLIVLLVIIAISSGCLSPHGWRIVPPEDLLVYQPFGPHPDDWEPPGLDYEDVYFTTEDEVRLHGWYCPVEDPKAIVLFAHGNAANITYRYPDCVRLTKELGVTVFAFDYRGYGRSEGIPNEPGLLADARAARKWLSEKTGKPESEIVLFGRSLGGGVMVDLAANDGAKALILESTFTSLPDVVNDLFPLSPGALMFNRFNSLKKISNYRGPLLIAHGTKDQLIPYSQGKELWQAANEPKQFVPIAEADHNWDPPPEYLEILDQFFGKLASRNTNAQEIKE